MNDYFICIFKIDMYFFKYIFNYHPFSYWIIIIINFDTWNCSYFCLIFAFTGVSTIFKLVSVNWAQCLWSANKRELNQHLFNVFWLNDIKILIITLNQKRTAVDQNILVYPLWLNTHGTKSLLILLWGGIFKDMKQPWTTLKVRELLLTNLHWRRFRGKV